MIKDGVIHLPLYMAMFLKDSSYANAFARKATTLQAK